MSKFTSGLVQLVSSESEQIKQAPNITIHIKSNRNCTNSSTLIETEKFPDIKFGSSIISNIQYGGGSVYSKYDILKRLYLRIKLPDLDENQRWISNIGYAIIKKITLQRPSDEEILSFTGEFMYIQDKFTLSDEQIRKKNKYMDIGRSKWGEKNKYINIPLDLFSGYNMDGNLKICMSSFNPLNLKIEYEDFYKLIEYDSDKLEYDIVKRNNITDRVEGIHTMDIEYKWECIVLSSTERQRLVMNSDLFTTIHHEEYKIESVEKNIEARKTFLYFMCYNWYNLYKEGQYLCDDILKLIYEYYITPLDEIDNKIDTGSNGLCKEMFWTFSNKYNYPLMSKRESEPINTFKYNRVSHNKLTIRTGSEDMILHEGEDDFRCLIPYKCHTNIPDMPIYNYSFCQLPENIDMLSEGINFGKLNGGSLKYKLLKSYEMELTIKVYYIIYNKLRYHQGIIAKEYST